MIGQDNTTQGVFPLIQDWRLVRGYTVRNIIHREHKVSVNSGLEIGQSLFFYF